MFDWDGIPEDPQELEAASQASVAEAERRERTVAKLPLPGDRTVSDVAAADSAASPLAAPAAIAAAVPQSSTALAASQPCAAESASTSSPQPPSLTIQHGAEAAESPPSRRGFRIGGVYLAAKLGPPSPLVPWMPTDHGRSGDASDMVPTSELEALRWMMQKVNLRQDMFLVAPPGPAARHLVLRFCALFGREVEYLGITRDTNEADLKQRREIRNGRVEHVDQPPVRAALAGRVLVLEGIEKAERNVLPLLNNLLENREMHLEDRRFLVSPERAAELVSCRSGGRDGSEATMLVPVHEDFIVVAIGMPGRGNPLDPPLRSRFSTFALSSVDVGASLGAPASANGSGHALPAGILSALRDVSAKLRTPRGAVDEDDEVAPGFPPGGIRSVVELLAKFPKLPLVDALRRVCPPMSSKQRQQLDKAAAVWAGASGGGGGAGGAATKPLEVTSLERAESSSTCPGTMTLEFRFPGGAVVEARAPAGAGGVRCEDAGDGRRSVEAEPTDLRQLDARALKAWLVERGVSVAGCLEKADLLRKAETTRAASASAAPRGVLAAPVGGLRLTASQRGTLVAMLTDHAVGADICLVGERGAGKSALVRAFAALMGYKCRVAFCYKDLISRDLLQRRTTDPRGNTEWHDSALVEAAISGDLAVLDGVHRLATGAVYSTLGELLADRTATLPDGSRLVHPERWKAIASERGLPADCRELTFDGVRLRPIHPAFRCVATAEPPSRAVAGGGGARGRGWLDEEVVTMFHFHSVVPLSGDEQMDLVRNVAGGGAVNEGDQRVFRGLISYGNKIRLAAKEDAGLEPLRLSARALLRIARHLSRRPGDVQGALNRAFSACLRFLPPSAQESVDRLLVEALKVAGLRFDGLRRERATAATESETRARRQELRQLENVAIQARMFGGYGGEQVDAARERAEEERRDQQRDRLDGLRRLGLEAARRWERPASGGAGAKIFVDAEGLLCIGDVRCPVRSPKRPELVPDVAFVEIPGHVDALRDMLLDWSLGNHLLLVGNQGVGKNKLVDRLLCLLRCEREYIQLHRDTTVQSLLLSPSLVGGVVVWEDSPLVRAVKEGRCLVVDEADKAPVEVVCVLKALCDDGELALPDGRTIVRTGDPRAAAADVRSGGPYLATSDGFRMLVLANRPGYPFLGNDFYGTCGDVFSCHTIDNPDIESEVALLRSIGPDVPVDTVVRLGVLFAELRDMVEAGQLAYPYSVRELAKLVRHLQLFPNDALESVAADVFALDVADPWKRGPLLEVLARHGIATTEAGRQMLTGEARAQGRMDLRLDEERDRSKDVTNPDNPDGSKPPEMSEDGPRHGDWDGGQHIGGNRFAGGSGGTGTAGLGGRWGPYRLDVGQKLVMVPEHLKQGLDDATKRKAEQMADEAYRKRLEELGLSPGDASQYAELRLCVASQIQEMKVCLESQEARERERQWLRHQTHGELDDSRLVDGITGTRTIYMRRGEPDASVFGSAQSLPKRMTFVMDISGSMYTFNRIDGRLRRLQELAVFLFESFAGFEAKYEYRMVGHSGTGAEAEHLVAWGQPPRSEKDRLAIAKRMEAHAQFCYPGDHTLEGTEKAIAEIGKHPADERFVFVVSDADLQRYNIDVKAWDRILHKDPTVKAYVILISNNVDEAERIKATLAPGRAHICAEAGSLAITFRQIFRDSILRGS